MNNIYSLEGINNVWDAAAKWEAALRYAWSNDEVEPHFGGYHDALTKTELQALDQMANDAFVRFPNDRAFLYNRLSRSAVRVQTDTPIANDALNQSEPVQRMLTKHFAE